MGFDLFRLGGVTGVTLCFLPNGTSSDVPDSYPDWAPTKVAVLVRSASRFSMVAAPFCLSVTIVELTCFVCWGSWPSLRVKGRSDLDSGSDWDSWKRESKLASESLSASVIDQSERRLPELRRASCCSWVGGETIQMRFCSVQRSHLAPEVGMHLRLRLRQVSHCNGVRFEGVNHHSAYLRLS